MRFWCKFGATLYATIFTISNGIAKTQRDNLSTSRDYRKPLFTGFLELSDVVESCKKCDFTSDNGHKYADLYSFRRVRFGLELANTKSKNKSEETVFFNGILALFGLCLNEAAPFSFNVE